MPISDEVIELAPVKKTKSTLIVMIVAMAVCLAMAVTFLVLYFLKPSVTEDKQLINSVTVTQSDFFVKTEGEEQISCASIGNEYTVYAELNTEQNAGMDVEWIYDNSVVHRIDSKNSCADGKAFFKFNLIGGSGQQTTITAQSSSQPEKVSSITFKVVEQGAEDIRVDSYGPTGNMVKVDNDTLENVITLEVPYYTINSNNNKTIKVSFNQFGAYNAATDTYAKLTSIVSDGKNTAAVKIELADGGDGIIELNSKKELVPDEGPNKPFELMFWAKKSGSTEIYIKANVNNDSKEITKTIKVNVVNNADKGYVDAFYVFDRPVVDAAFIAKIVKSGSIDSSLLNKEIGERGLKFVSTDRRVASNGGEIVFPWHQQLTYNDISKHVLLNPVSIQYADGKIKDNFFQSISVDTTDKDALSISEKKITPKALPKGTVQCALTFTDSKPGSVGASVTIPARVVAQNIETGAVTVDSNPSAIDVPTAAGKKHNIFVTFNISTPNSIDTPEKAKAMFDAKQINASYMLDFKSDELKVRYEGEAADAKPGEIKIAPLTVADFTKIGNGGKFTVKLKLIAEIIKTGDTDINLKFIKVGSMLAESGGKNLRDYDKTWELGVSFKSSTLATSVKVAENAGGLDIVTANNTISGNYKKINDTKAQLYVQRALEGELALSKQDEIKKFLVVDSVNYIIGTYTITPILQQNESTGVFRVDNGTSPTKLIFTEVKPKTPTTMCATIKFDVLNVKQEQINKESITFEIFVIDGITEVVVEHDKRQTPSVVEYGLNVAGNAIAQSSVAIAAADITVNHASGKSSQFGDYPDINLYYTQSDSGKFEKSELNDFKYKFGHKATTATETTWLYEFDIEHRKLTVLEDVFAYSYANNVNLSIVWLEFLMRADAEYVGKNYSEKYSGRNMKMYVQFVRNADDVAVYTETNYTGNKVTANSDGNFPLSSNQGMTLKMAVSSVIYPHGDSSHPIYVKEINKGIGLDTVAAAATFKYTSTDGFPGMENGGHYVFEGSAPSVPTGFESKVHEFLIQAHGLKTEKKIILTVQNAVRGISEIKLFQPDNAGNMSTTEITGLKFGKYFAADDESSYSKVVWISATYEDHDDKYTSFESAELKLPSYLKLDGVQESSTDNDGNRLYIISPVEYVNGSYTMTKKCTLMFDGTGSKSGTIVVSSQKVDGSGVKKSASCGVAVGTGLKTITVTNGSTSGDLSSGTGNAPISRSIVIASNNDATSGVSAAFTLAYAGYETDAQKSITYDRSKLSLRVGRVTDTGIDWENYPSGVTIAQTVGSDTAGFTITATSAAIGTYGLMFEFTDSSSGTNVTFTVRIDLTVVVDIYSLGFGAVSPNNVTVTGADTGEQTFTVGVNYNGGASVTDTIVKSTDANIVKLYKKSAASNEYVSCNSSDGIAVERSVESTGVTYTVKVANNIDIAYEYYLRLEYKTIHSNYEQIIISSSDTEIVFVTGAGYIALDNNNAASIMLKKDNNIVKLAVKIVNKGTDTTPSGTLGSITYGLYGDEGCTTVSSVASFNDAKNEITITPNSATGVVYYKATYTGSSGIQSERKAKLSYAVMPSGVNIITGDTGNGKLSGSVYENPAGTNPGSISLFYGKVDGKEYYTYINLHGKLKAICGFENIDLSANIENYSVSLSNTSNSNLLEIVSDYQNGKLIIKPKGLPTSGTQTDIPIKLSVKCKNCNMPESTTYNVHIWPMPDLEFDGKADVGTLDITKTNPSLEVKVPVRVSNTFDAGFDLIGNDSPLAIAKSGELTAESGNNKIKSCTFIGTVTPKTDANVTAASYTLAAKLKYTFSANGVDFFGSSDNSYTVTKNYTVNIGGSYTPGFKIQYSVNSGTSYTDLPVNTSHAIAAGELYRLVVDALPTGTTTGVNYSFASANNMFTFGAYNAENRTVTFTINTNMSGTERVIVTATILGKTFTCEQSYTFSYGDSATTKLYCGTNYSTEITDFAVNHNIDYSGEDGYKLKFAIRGVSSDVFSAISNFVFNVTGADAVSGVSIEGSGENQVAYVIITVKKPGKLYLGGTVRVGNRTVYLENKSITLVATEPVFAVHAKQNSIEKSVINPSEFVDLSVENNAQRYQGAITVTYAIVSGDTFAKLDSANSKLIANNNITTGGSVTVRAYITVASGAFKDRKFTADTTITVNGAALPTVRWNDNAEKIISRGTLIDYTGKFVTSQGDTNATFSIEVTNSRGLTSADYLFDRSNNKEQLTVRSTDNTKAGGKITLRLKANIASGAHAGDNSIYADLDVVIKPDITVNAAKTINIQNAKGTVDIAEKVREVINVSRSGCTVADVSDYYSVESDAAYGTEILEISDNTTNSAGNGNFGFSGNNLIIENNIANAGRIKLKVKLTFTSGAYTGYSIDLENIIVDVTTFGSRTSAAEWDTATNGYKKISLGKENVLSTTVETRMITSVTVSATGENAKYLTVENNGSATPNVVIDKFANFYVAGSDPGAKTIGAVYLVTLNDGSVYYVPATYNVPSHSVSVKAKIGDLEVVAADSLYTVDSGNSFALNFTADSGFIVVVSSVTIGGTYASRLAYAVGGTGILFTADTTASDLNDISVTVKSDVAGKEHTLSFKVGIAALGANTLYSIENAEGIFAKGGTKVINAKWTKNASNSYQYHDKVTVIVPTGKLWDYINKIEIRDSAKGLINEYTLNDSYNSRSRDFVFNSRNTSRTEFFIMLTINDTAGAAWSNIVVSVHSYVSNTAWSAQTNISHTYKVRVVDKVTVTLNANGGKINNSDIAQIEPAYKGNYGVAGFTNAVRPGYKFEGWYESPDNSNRIGGEYNGAKTVDKPDAHTLYAHWTPNEYNLTYSATDTGATAPVGGANKVTYGSKYGTLATTSRPGYEFAGWYTSFGADGKLITADTLVEQTTTDSDTITLYAHWTAATYQVEYHKNYGPVCSDGDACESRSVVYNGKYNLPAPPTREGYVFAGWYTVAESTGGTHIEAGSSFIDTSNVILYARWTALLDVTLDANGGIIGSVDTYVTSVATGSTYGLHKYIVPTRTGWTFAGWYNGNTDSATRVTADITVNAAVRLYAKWKAVVTFDLNYTDASAAPAAREIMYAADAKYGELPTPTRTDWTFDGWYNGTVKVESTTALSGNVTLVAKWKAVVTFNPANGSGVENVDYLEGTVYGSNSKFTTAPTRTDWAFVGWYNGTAKVESHGAVSGNVTLVAKWKAVVTFNPANGSGVENVDYLEGTVYGSNSKFTTAPTRTVWTFDGWYNGTAKVESTTALAGNITLVAKWKVDIKLINRDDTTKTVDITAYEGDAYSKLSEYAQGAFVAAGKEIKELSTDPEGATKITLANEINPSVTTLYAKLGDKVAQTVEPSSDQNG